MVGALALFVGIFAVLFYGLVLGAIRDVLPHRQHDTDAIRLHIHQ